MPDRIVRLALRCFVVVDERFKMLICCYRCLHVAATKKSSCVFLRLSAPTDPSTTVYWKIGRTEPGPAACP